MASQGNCMRLATIVLILVGLLGGCGLLPEQIDETRDWSAQRLYSAAKEAMSDADWEKAIGLFEKLEARYAIPSAVTPSRRCWSRPTPTTSSTNRNRPSPPSTAS